VEPALIGYFPKRVTSKPDWLTAPAVLEICSVSECIAAAPDGWIHRWTHNELWVYDTRRAAAAVVPVDAHPPFRIYAYRLLARLFQDGRQGPLEIPALAVEPLPETFEALGFDAVSRSAGTSFECSPLSCCDLAQEMGANRFCLLPTLPAAIAAAVRFSTEQPEPGPYLVLEVLRDAGAV
jgi:hypothetical protein